MRAVSRAMLMMGLTFRRGPTECKVLQLEVGGLMTCMAESGPYQGQTFPLPITQFYDEYGGGHIVDLRTQGRPTQLIPHGAATMSARLRRATNKQIAAAKRKQDYILKMREGGPICFDMKKSKDDGLRDIERRLRQVALKREESKPPSRTAFYNWYRAYMRGGQCLEALLSRRVRRGRERKSKLHPVVEAAVQHAVDLVIAGTKKSNRELADDLATTLAKYNEANPTEKPLSLHAATLDRRIRNLPIKVHMTRKHGARAANKQLASYEKVEDPTFPLEVVQTDHTLLDIPVWDEKLRKRHKGVWMTCFLDRRSRVVLGYTLHIEQRDSEVVERCLSMAVLPKTHFRHWCPHAENDWPCFGLPFKVVCDNGLEFLSDVVTDLCAKLGINVVPAQGHTPEYKGAIERWFRTIKDSLIKKLRTQKHVRERPDLPRDCLTLSELDAEIGKWIVDVYHRAKHSKLNDRAPIDVWNAEVQGIHLPLASSAEELLATVGLRAERSLGADGINLDYDVYTSQELKDLRVKLGPAAEKVEVIYSSRTAHYIFVVDPVDDVYVKAFNTNSACRPEYTREHWCRIRQAATKLGLDVNTVMGSSIAAASVHAQDEKLAQDDNASPSAVARAVRSAGGPLFAREDAQSKALIEQRARELVQEELKRIKGKGKGNEQPSADNPPTPAPSPAVSDDVVLDLTAALIEVPDLDLVSSHRFAR
ncbi:MAG: hypothetical protein ACTHL8_24420 [Burkholderiaceae bacterium]